MLIDFLCLEMPEETHEFHDTAFVIHLTANKELRHPYIWYTCLRQLLYIFQRAVTCSTLGYLCVDSFLDRLYNLKFTEKNLAFSAWPV